MATYLLAAQELEIVIFFFLGNSSQKHKTMGEGKAPCSYDDLFSGIFQNAFFFLLIFYSQNDSMRLIVLNWQSGVKPVHECRGSNVAEDFQVKDSKDQHQSVRLAHSSLKERSFAGPLYVSFLAHNALTPLCR